MSDGAKKKSLRNGLAVLLCSVVLVCATKLSGATLPIADPNSTDAHRSTERVVVAIEGMYCDGCAAGIKAMLKRTPGVVAAEVSYEKKEAVVDYDSEKTTPEKIVEAINKLGYKATVKNKS